MNGSIVRPAFVLAVVAATVVTSCAPRSSSARQSPNSATTPSPLSEPQELSSHTVVDPGEYITPDFRPQMTLTLRTTWWIEGEEPTALNMEPGESYRDTQNLIFVDVERVIDPRTQRRVLKAPKDLLQWFLDHPRLRVLSKPQAVTVGGVRGIRFDVKATRPTRCIDNPSRRCVLLMPFRPGDPFSPSELASGPPLLIGDSPNGIIETVRIVLLNVEGRRLAIFFDDEPKLFPRSVRLEEQILQTIRFV